MTIPQPPCLPECHVLISDNGTLAWVKVEDLAVPESLTTAGAAKRLDVEEVFLNRMCLRGTALAKQHGGWSKVPERDKKTALNAKKVANRWFIPAMELARVFLP